MFFLRSSSGGVRETKRKSSSSSSKKKNNPKIILLGSLPKSSKMNLFLNNQYCLVRYGLHRVSQQPAMGVQLNTVPFRYKNQTIFLDIWNLTILFERYDKLASIYTENISAIVGVCSLQSILSVEKMKYWIKKFQAYNPDGIKIQILCFDKSIATNNNNQVKNLLQEFSRKQIIDYSKEIDAELHFINSCTIGKDTNRFFNLFLRKFASKTKSNSNSSTSRFKKLIESILAVQ